MNENLNLVEILKDCPKGTKLYSPAFGYVELVNVSQDSNTIDPIEIKTILYGTTECFTPDGKIYAHYNGECLLFPSKEQRDWSKFKPKKQKFDPKTLQPFDKVLVRDINSSKWKIQLFSHVIERDVDYPYVCITNPYRYCIPFNDYTKHLLDTNEEAPEFYRYWE